MTIYRLPKRGPAKTSDYLSQAIGAGAYLDVISVDGSGELDELMVLSPNTNFGVTLATDGTTILSKTYTQLNALTQSLRFVSAFAEVDESGTATGKYLIHIKGISFLESLVARVTNTGGASATFDIFGKYTLS